MFRARVAVMSGVALFAACGPREIETVSGNVRYFEVAGQPRPCAGNAAFLDSVGARFSSYLGLSIEKPYEYHYRPDGTELPCPKGSFGCTDPVSAKMWARRPDETHELVHALLAQHSINSTPFFEEGLALALGTDLGSGILRETPTVDALLEQKDALAYSTDELVNITIVVAALLRRNGPDALVQAMREIPPESSAATSKRVLNAAFGFEFDAFAAELRDAGVQPTHLGLRECATPSEPLEGSLDVSCGVNAAGPLPDSVPPTMYLSRTFSVNAPAAYAMRVSGGAPTSAVFFNLYDCESSRRQATQGAGGGVFSQSRLLLKFFLSSSWSLAAAANDAYDNRLQFSFSASDAGTVSGCAGEALTIDPEIDSIDFDVADGSMPLWALRSQASRVATLGPGMAVELCTDGCGSSCVRHDATNETVTFSAGATVWLRPLVSSSIGFSALR